MSEAAKKNRPKPKNRRLLKPQGVGMQLLAAMVASNQTMYHISQNTGVDQATLSRFTQMQAGMSLHTFERLCEYFHLRLRRVRE